MVEKKKNKKNGKSSGKYVEPPKLSDNATVMIFPKSKISPAMKTLFMKYGQILTKEQAGRFENFLKEQESSVEKEEVYTFLRENPDIRKRIWNS